MCAMRSMGHATGNFMCCMPSVTAMTGTMTGAMSANATVTHTLTADAVVAHASTVAMSSACVPTSMVNLAQGKTGNNEAPA